MAKASPIQFLRQVRGEIKKITWPTRKETTVSTVFVFAMVFVMAVFLYLADQFMAFIVSAIMGF